MKGRTGAITPFNVEMDKAHRKQNRDYDRGIKRQIGQIREIDAHKDGHLYVFVDVPDGNGGLRAFGQDKTPVVIVDSPLDILLRYGGVKVGQIVELIYRGIGESGQAAAHIIGDETQDLVNAEQVPEEGFDVASSLPFEPMGII